MSPEQVAGKPLDGRTDLFSFGVVLYEMATGSCAFESDQGIDVRGHPARAASWCEAIESPGISERLEEIIHKSLEKDRNLRYQHASEMRADLQRLKRDTDSGHISCDQFIAGWPRRKVLWLDAGCS